MLCVVCMAFTSEFFMGVEVFFVVELDVLVCPKDVFSCTEPMIPSLWD